MFLVVEIYWRS